MPLADRIQRAYGRTGNIYDGLLTGGSLLGRLYLRVFWNGIDVRSVADRLLSRIPADFSGRILDVPAGTAVFTSGKWSSLGDARIICLDYSEDMLEQARTRLDGVRNVSFVCGDVGDLPLEDGSCDIVLSMNGFHAFPDKGRALGEIDRVLKDGGMLLASFYVRGESGITDWLARNVLSRKGWFTPPFYTRGEVERFLGKRYCDVRVDTDGSIVFLSALKGSPGDD